MWSWQVKNLRIFFILPHFPGAWDFIFLLSDHESHGHRKNVFKKTTFVESNCLFTYYQSRKCTNIWKSSKLGVLSTHNQYVKFDCNNGKENIFSQYTPLQRNMKHTVHVNCTLVPLSQDKVIHWGKTFKKYSGLLFKKTFTQVLDSIYFPFEECSGFLHQPLILT